MGDVKIVIKDGHIVGVDGEDGDDSDMDAISGSGETDLDTVTTTDSAGYLTPTSNNNKDRNAATKIGGTDETNLLPFIIAGVAGVVVLILVILFIVWCRRRRRRRRQRSPSKKQNTGPVVYSPNGHGDAGGCGEGYSVAIPLTMAESPPMEDAPPPPVPASAPPKPPGLTASGGSATSQRYTPLGGRKGVSTNPMPGASDPKDLEDDKGSIYASIDDTQVANVYEEAVPAPPKSNSGRRPHRLSSTVEDPNMGSEKDQMLPPGSPV